MGILRWAGVYLAAMVGGLLGAVPVATLGLVVSQLIILPLMLFTGAMFAALSAAWMGNLLAPQDTRSRLTPIIAATELSAVPLAVAVLGLMLWLESRRESPPILFLLILVCVLILAAVATFATWRVRAPRRPLGRDLLATLGWLGITLLAIIGSIALAFALGLVGA